MKLFDVLSQLHRIGGPMSCRDDRQAIAKLDGVDAKAFSIIQNAEEHTLVAIPELCESLSSPTRQGQRTEETSTLRTTLVSLVAVSG
jgi:hypothetical protein